MFWDIFFQSLAVIVLVMIVGYAIDYLFHRSKRGD